MFKGILYLQKRLQVSSRLSKMFTLGFMTIRLGLLDILMLDSRMILLFSTGTVQLQLFWRFIFSLFMKLTINSAVQILCTCGIVCVFFKVPVMGYSPPILQIVSSWFSVPDYRGYFGC